MSSDCKLEQPILKELSISEDLGICASVTNFVEGLWKILFIKVAENFL